MKELHPPYRLQLHVEHLARQARMAPPRAPRLLPPLAPAPPPVLPPPEAGPPGSTLTRRQQRNVAWRKAAFCRANPPLRGEKTKEFVYPTMAKILLAVSRQYDVRVSAICGPAKHNLVCRPRQIAMYLAARGTRFSLSQIGKSLGDRDHSTVLHGAQKIDRLIKTDEALANEIAALRRCLEAADELNREAADA